MAAPSYEEIEEVIEFRLNQVIELLEEFDYELNKCTAKELYDYLIGKSFKEEKLTFRERLGNEYLLLHSVIEISELKAINIQIGIKTKLNTPKEQLYAAHLKAMDYELGYSLILEDFYWLKHRLGMYARDIKTDDHLPETLKPRAMEIYKTFIEYKDY
jgi:hypothetical protein